MNRINPFYIGVILLAILLFLAIKLGSVKSELKETKASYKETLKLSTDLSGLKEVYSNKERIKKSLQRILELSSLSAAKIEKKSSNSGIVISSESINKNELNSLMGKILNGSFNIGALKIKKLSNTNASLYMEIKW